MNVNEEEDTTGLGLTSSTSGDTTGGDASGIPNENLQVCHSQSNQALIPSNQPKTGELALAQRGIMQRFTVPAVLQPVHPVNPFEPHARSFPADIKIVQIGDTNEWMCDVCKGAVFDNFVEACMHEMICKSAHGHGSAVGLSAKFPAQVSNVFPSVGSFGLPNSTVAPRDGPMLPMQSTLHSAVFPSSIVRAPVPTVQGPTLGETATASTTYALSTATDLNDSTIHPKETSEVIKDVTLDVSLVPENRNLLSDYNYILAQNIEFFETPSSYAVPASLLGNMKELPTTKIGLRCVHCIFNGVHITAASFFPSSISSLSSGMGTIGSRHFLGGKCTFVPEEVVASLSSAKRHSQQQTRSPGKVGLDAYCKQVAKTNKMRDHEIGGVYISNQGLAEKDGCSTSGEMSTRAQVTKSCNISVPNDKVGQETFSGSDVSNLVRKPVPVPPRDPIPDRNDPSAFLEGSVEHFWECKHCNSLPFHWRATGSVVFCAEKPTIELVVKHLSVCQGKKPLSIPRNAAIKVKTSGNSEHGPSVIVQWCNDEGKRKSSRTKRQSLGPGDNPKKKRKTVASVSLNDVQSGVDEASLALPQEKALTTDFAYFTVEQLKKCYLTKSGGSRGNCPVGYPGLACSYCVGSPTQRRFFYTSADHLRNSFSHIPSHLLACSKCPPEVKAKIEEYKSLRNRQKAQLKVGDHKQFIDRVWTKLHGEGGGAVSVAEEEYVVVEDASDDDRSITSLSVDFEFNPNDDYLHESLDGRFLESKEIAIETSESAILSSSDRKLSTNYVFFALLQLMPKQYVVDSEGTLSEIVLTDDDGEKKDETEDNFTKKEDESAPKTLQDCCTVTESATGNNESGDPAIAKDDNLKTETRPVSDANDDRENEEITEPEMFNTLVCKHCKNEDMQAIFLPESAQDLQNSFSDVTAHLASCEKCPQSVKTKLDTLKAFRPIQEALLKRGAQKKLMKNAWNRVENYFQEPTEDTIPPEPQVPEYHNNTEVLSTELLTEDDRVLVSEFTFYTLEQMLPCILDNSGNGSRSMFTFGFPGLGCKHCAGKTNARKFFYRTAEILSGNYAHIPNHVLSCRHAPLEVKQTLAAKKKIHPSQKQRLSRGSQRRFFEGVFTRLVCRTML